MAHEERSACDDGPTGQDTKGTGDRKGTIISMSSQSSDGNDQKHLLYRNLDSPKNQEFQRSRRIQAWSWEILAAIVSITSLAVVTTSLLVMDGQRLVDWKLPVSPNAIVSILVTFSKSSLLMLVAEGISQLKWIYFAEKEQRLYDLQIFDAASRGPWGAVRLLLARRIKPALVCIGAVVTIVALAMDPCAQQILELRTVMLESPTDTAMIRTATAYEVAVQEGSGISAFAGIDLILNITNAVYAGMFHGSSKTQVEHLCSTANCTWDSFQSLGVCSTCANETDLATATCVSSNSTNSVDSTTHILQNCTYTTENGVALKAGTSFDPATRAHNKTVLQTILESQAWIEDTDLSAQLANISIIRFGPQLEWHLPWPAIYTCKISLCQKTFQPAVVNGSLFDNIIDTQPLAFSGCRLNSSKYHCPAYTLDQMPMETEVDPSTTSNTIWISTDAVTSMSTLLKTLLTQTNSNIGMKRLATDPQALMASMLWKLNDGDIPQTIDDITMAMTNQIREGPNSTWVEGEAMMPTVTVHVNWWWFILPVGVVVVGVGFLVALVFGSRDSGVPVWKSSALATVIHTFGDRNLGDASLEGMQHAAKNTRVRLRTDLHGRLALVGD